MESRIEVQDKSGPDPGKITGVFTLKNTSNEPINIEYNTHPLVFLDVDVQDDAGRSLPKAIPAYGLIYSPTSPELEVLTIKPGESYSTTLALFTQVDQKRRPVGPRKYSVEAVYKVNGVGVRTNKVTIEITAK